MINAIGPTSSLEKGETFHDMGKVISQFADMVALRHPLAESVHQLAAGSKIPVFNAGNGSFEHPTQALLDAYTIRNHFSKVGGDLSGLEVAIVGDILHSRVARSNVLLLEKLGANVTLIAPPTLMPVGVASWKTKVSYDLDANLEKYDVVMMLRIQSERMKDAYFPSEREYSRGYGLDQNRLGKMKSGSIVMHPGPMNRGLEISADSADSINSVILEQVTNGVLIRMSVLYSLLGGAL